MEPAADPRAVRAGRAAAGSTAGVLVALAAHLAGGGAAPDPLVLAAVLAAMWPVAVLLVGRGSRLRRQAAVVAIAQAALHSVFALGAPASVADGMAGMHGGPLPVAAPADHHGAPMWWAHVAAWLLTVAAWSHGERVLRRLVARSPLLAALLLLAAAAEPARSATRPLPVPAPARAAAPRSSHRDRGPPLPA